jgi:uncharacterized protein (DUF2267 family)
MPEVKDVKVDLSQLKNNIAAQKKELHSKQVALGQGNGQPMKTSKKSFLNELVTSMRTGQKSEAIEVVRAVNETVEYKRGAPPAVAKNREKRSHIPQRPQQRQQVNEEYDPQNPPVRRSGADDWGMGNQGGGYNRSGGDDREAEFDRAFNHNNAAFDRMMRERNPMVANNPKYQQMMDRHQPQQEEYVVEQPGVINEQLEVLNEKIEKNLDKMVESAFKNVLSDIYTKQKIQEALGEYLKSDDFIKVVGQAINEIAKRNKAKQGSK